MSKFPFPIRIPQKSTLILTQKFGETANLQWYKDNGINFDGHNGADVTVSGFRSSDTYGTPLVCPFPEAQTQKVYFDTPMSSSGNGMRLYYRDPAGTTHEIILWHASEVVNRPSFKQGATVAYIGNSGLVTPKPSAGCPYCGSHLHFGYYRNGELTDPLLYFDIASPFRGIDTGFGKDLPPLKFFFINPINAILRQIGLPELLV